MPINCSSKLITSLLFVPVQNSMLRGFLRGEDYSESAGRGQFLADARIFLYPRARQHRTALLEPPAHIRILILADHVLSFSYASPDRPAPPGLRHGLHSRGVAVHCVDAWTRTRCDIANPVKACPGANCPPFPSGNTRRLSAERAWTVTRA